MHGSVHLRGNGRFEKRPRRPWESINRQGGLKRDSWMNSTPPNATMVLAALAAALLHTTPPPVQSNATALLHTTPPPTSTPLCVTVSIALSYLLLICCCGYCCTKCCRAALEWWVCGCPHYSFSRRDASVGVVVYSSLVFGPSTAFKVERFLHKHGRITPLPPAALDPDETVISVHF